MHPSAYVHLSASEAIAYQKHLRERLQLTPLEKDIKTIAGADISFNKYSETVYAGIVVLSYPGLKVLESVSVKSTAGFPYITGLLAFREIPALMDAWGKLTIIPDILVCDGQGLAHPRRMGIACHFGIIAGIPTIGCGKTRLVGMFDEPENEALSESYLVDKDEIVGTVLRTRKNCKPVFISPGNKITIEQSSEIIKNCVGKYRIPEPTRLAHLLVNEARMKDKS